MSRLTYLACNKKLPVGPFTSRPIAIYSNYAEYRKSPDYIIPDDVCTQPPFEFAPQIYDSNCPVWVYPYYNELHYLNLCNYESCRPTTIFDFDEDAPDEEVIEQLIKDQDVTNQFSVPYIYYIGMMCNEDTLRRFLCEYLNPGDIAERYDCWACEEIQERDKRHDIVVDLQCYLDSQDISLDVSDYSKNECKLFVTYHAPSSSGFKNDWILDEDVINIYLDKKLEMIPYDIGEQFGIHM